MGDACQRPADPHLGGAVHRARGGARRQHVPLGRHRSRTRVRRRDRGDHRGREDSRNRRAHDDLPRRRVRGSARAGGEARCRRPPYFRGPPPGPLHTGPQPPPPPPPPLPPSQLEHSLAVGAALELPTSGPLTSTTPVRIVARPAAIFERMGEHSSELVWDSTHTQCCILLCSADHLRGGRVARARSQVSSQQSRRSVRRLVRWWIRSGEGGRLRARQRVDAVRDR